MKINITNLSPNLAGECIRELTGTCFPIELHPNFRECSHVPEKLKEYIDSNIRVTNYFNSQLNIQVIYQWGDDTTLIIIDCAENIAYVNTNAKKMKWIRIIL